MTAKAQAATAPAVPVHTAPGLGALAGIRHGFFGRRGGVSTGIYASLNCGLGTEDLRKNIVENRTRVAAALGVAPDHLLTAYQIHSPIVVTVGAPWTDNQRPEADAIVTRKAGLALGISTADCVPILLADAEAQVVGAAHAGWKGALTGIVEAAVEAMTCLGAAPERIIAAIGPAISARSYQVDTPFRDRFLKADRASEDLFVPDAQERRWRFDLPGFTARRLAALGLSRIDVLDLCTYEDEAAFFSYRRATHRDEPDYGRNLSAIVLTAE